MRQAALPYCSRRSHSRRRTPDACGWVESFEEFTVKKGKTISYAVIVTAFAAAFVAAFSRNRTPEPALAPNARPIVCLCTQCNHHLEMSYADYTAAIGQAESASKPSGGRVSVEQTSGATPSALKCPSCGAGPMVSAGHCDRHDVYYPNRKPDGSVGRCPQCPVPS